MVATTAFVLLFVVLGLTTLLVAMRGGPRGMRNAKPSRAGDNLTGIIALVAVIVGLGVPVLILANNSGAHERNGVGGVKLTSAQVTGRHLFAENCATCHSLRGARAVGKVGPNLDELRPPKALVLNAVQMGRARGQGQMPALLLTGNDANDVASFVAAVAGR